MNRRNFIRKASMTGAGAIMLGGIPVKAMTRNQMFKYAAAAGDGDNVLVFIQLHGGNDALNTVVPISQYVDYYNLRPNLAIPESGTRSFINADTTVAEELQVGLHPDMLAIKEMYDQGKVAIVQNVGYPDMNMSHFRGRDIVFMGGDAYDDYESGWMGRWLDHEYPGYPDAYPSEQMPDPIGMELSGTLSLAFHREEGIPIGLNVGSPEGFYQLINSVGVTPPIAFPDSHAGDELRYIMEFEKKSNEYAERLRNVYNAGSNSSVVYPTAYPYLAPEGYINNPLSGQLKLIARLLAGGIKTRIFLCRIGGFDTHGEQVIPNYPTLGQHAALLYHLSTSVKAFYDDLAALGLDSKVLSMTFTEFGRRAYSNASYGTDHGSSTPVILFGTGLNAGIYGQNPDLTDLNNGNLKYNVDYRQIYTTVVQDWFGASNEAMNVTGFADWVDNRLPLIGQSSATNEPHRKNAGSVSIYPNPVRDEFSVQFFLKNSGDCQLTIFNVEGKVVYTRIAKGRYGVNTLRDNITSLNAGKYIVQVKSGRETFTSQFLKL